MKNAKSFLLSSILIFLTSFSLYSASITITGYGKTPAEAQIDARNRLNEYINGSLVSSTTINTTVDDGNSSSTKFKESSTVQSEGFLIGVEYSKPEKLYDSATILGDFAVVATISESSIPIYESRLSESRTTICTIYSQRKSEDSSTKKKSDLLTLISHVREFDSLKQVLFYLSPEKQIESLDVPVTASSLLNEYENLLLSENDNLLNDINSGTKTSIEIQSIQAEIKSNNEARAEIQKQKSDAEKQAAELAERNLQDRISQILQNQKDIQMSYNLGESLPEHMQQLKDLCKDFELLSTSFSSLIEEEIKRIDNDLEAETNSIMNSEYRRAELDRNGNPSPAAVKLREDKVDTLIHAKKTEKATSTNHIKSELIPTIQEKLNEITDTVEIIENINFELHSPTDIKINTFIWDGASESWFVNAEILGTGTKFEFRLPYEDLFGSKFDLSSEDSKSNIDLIAGLMNENGIFLTVNLTSEIALNTGSITYTITNVKIITGEYNCTIKKSIEVSNRFTVFKIDTSVLNYLNLSQYNKHTEEIPVYKYPEGSFLNYMQGIRLGLNISIGAKPFQYTPISSNLIRVNAGYLFDFGLYLGVQPEVRLEFADERFYISYGCYAEVGYKISYFMTSLLLTYNTNRNALDYGINLLFDYPVTKNLFIQAGGTFKALLPGEAFPAIYLNAGVVYEF